MAGAKGAHAPQRAFLTTTCAEKKPYHSTINCLASAPDPVSANLAKYLPAAPVSNLAKQYLPETARHTPGTAAKWRHRPNGRSSARTQRSCLLCGPTSSPGSFRRLHPRSYPASFHRRVPRRMTARPARPPPTALDASPSVGLVGASSYAW